MRDHIEKGRRRGREKGRRDILILKRVDRESGKESGVSIELEG